MSRKKLLSSQLSKTLQDKLLLLTQKVGRKIQEVKKTSMISYFYHPPDNIAKVKDHNSFKVRLVIPVEYIWANKERYISRPNKRK